MKILLVRHAKAVKRSQWTEADDLRPLTAQGERQATGIQSLLKDVPLRRICSSPALRCRKTVERLAADHSLNVEVDTRIAADTGATEANAEGALRLLEEKGGAPLLICAGGTLILEILRSLALIVVQSLRISVKRPKSLRILESPIPGGPFANSKPSP